MKKTKKLPAILVAGVSSGSGKTTLTRGILSYFVDKGIKVQSYKLGPDYIDSGHHAVVTGRPCINLDRYLLSVPDASEDSAEHSKRQLLEEFHSGIGDAEVLVIEAVGGLFDDWHNDFTGPWACFSPIRHHGDGGRQQVGFYLPRNERSHSTRRVCV